MSQSQTPAPAHTPRRAAQAPSPTTDTAAALPEPRSASRTHAARAINVTKRYGRADTAVTALENVSLDFEQGRMTAIMGPSGSGKSTLMHVLAGLDTVTTGQVMIGDRDITALGDEELTTIRRRHIGFIFQAFNLVPTTDVLGNVLLPFELDNRSPDATEQQWIDSLIERLGLTDRVKHRPGELSGGQQQRVAIARALATRPDMIFADEPTGNLDSRTSHEVLTLLGQSVRDYGQSIALVTHDAHAASYADRVVFIVDGRLVQELRAPYTAADVSGVMMQLEANAMHGSAA
ncbi:MAG: ABC transporter ATP-binding protein [Propionibacteriales bacterium]|nr:ABC transporter ATP-binding protein [Propionibacteriales bacterium]